MASRPCRKRLSDAKATQMRHPSLTQSPLLAGWGHCRGAPCQPPARRPAGCAAAVASVASAWAGEATATRGRVRHGRREASMRACHALLLERLGSSVPVQGKGGVEVPPTTAPSPTMLERSGTPAQPSCSTAAAQGSGDAPSDVAVELAPTGQVLVQGQSWRLLLRLAMHGHPVSVQASAHATQSRLHAPGWRGTRQTQGLRAQTATSPGVQTCATACGLSCPSSCASASCPSRLTAACVATGLARSAMMSFFDVT